MLLLRFAAFAALVLAAGCYNAPDPGRAVSTGPGGLAGAPATSFDLPRIGGGTDSLARHRGSVVLVNLWATWCAPCREELPALERFARANTGRVTVLGIDQGEAADVAASFAREHGVTFPVLVDERQQYGGTYAAAGLPTSIIVSRDGRIVRAIDGPLTQPQMKDAVAPALAAR